MNGVPLNGTTRQVDNFNQLGKGNVATIFVRQGDDFLRIATSLKKEDGNRAVGTQLGRRHQLTPAFAPASPSSARATLFGHHYMTNTPR